MRLSILADYRNVINFANKIRKKKSEYKNFIYVIRPIVDEDEEEGNTEWEGGFNFLRKAINRKIEKLKRNNFNNSQKL